MVVGSAANVVVATVYILIVYWFVGFVSTASQFFVFWAMVNSIVFSADSLGIMLGSSFPNPVMAVSLGPGTLIFNCKRKYSSDFFFFFFFFFCCLCFSFPWSCLADSM